jgi:succinate dehydrogenase / fumarate reductase cytochrome b subunit
MKSILALYQSSIGKKWIVALTGAILVAYVIGHLLGNLQIFAGRSQINRYADFLHSHEIILWMVRLILIAAFVLHILTTVKLVAENRAARPVRYAHKVDRAATTAGKTMIISGVILFCFVVFHLLHFTTQNVNPEFRTYRDEQGRHDVFKMMIVGFQNPLASGFYVVGMYLLCMHLSHGAQSILQTLGLNNKTQQQLQAGLMIASRVFAWIIFAGYVSIPLAVVFGFLKAPT